jgi:hypothetical protein
MTEADITHLMALNRQAFSAWLMAALIWTIGVFFLAYVIRSTPAFVRGAVFAAYLLGAFSLYMTMNIANAGFVQLVQDLAAASPQAGFSKGVVDALGATPTQAGSFPIWATLFTPLIYLLNVLVALYLLLLAKWEA